PAAGGQQQQRGRKQHAQACAGDGSGEARSVHAVLVLGPPAPECGRWGVATATTPDTKRGGQGLPQSGRCRRTSCCGTAPARPAAGDSSPPVNLMQYVSLHIASD